MILLGRCMRRGRRRSFISSILLNTFLSSLTPKNRHYCSYPFTPSRHRLLHTHFSFHAAFPATTICSSAYRRRDRAGLDTPVDLPRRTAHLAHLDDGARELEVIREDEEYRERCILHFICILITSVLTIPSYSRPIFNIAPNYLRSRLATSNDLHNTMLQLGQRMFTHSTASVPTIVACVLFRSQAQYTRQRPHRRTGVLGQVRQDRCIARQLRRESVGRGMAARSVVRRQNRLGQ